MSASQHNTTNKERAISLLQQVVDGKIKEAYQTYISSNFIHHNPHFSGDGDSLRAAMEEDAIKNPHKTFEVHHALEEKDTVVVHSHIKQNPQDVGAAVVHIFRFQDQRVVEMWDIGQPIPEDSPNERGPF